MLRIKEIARQVADTDAPVLMLGESGVGKEVLARYIHGQSRRARQPFVKVNCAALPQDLLESELFGYEKGAFSGAFREKPGMFELADKGSILLDEIGEMTPSLQAKLLHVLQDGDYTRLGGRHRLHVDARVLASTNIQLEEAVGAGRFRQDLYFRLNVIRIDIPPLRDRRDDIPMLCAHFLRTYAARYRSTRAGASAGAARRVPALRLAGQRPRARERRPALRDPARPGDGAFVPGQERRRRRTPVARRAAGERFLRKVGAQAAEEAERQLLRRTLAETRWNRKEAAAMLQISYKALLNKLKKWEVEEPV